MIPEKFMRIARAEYLCNVSQFVSLGHGKNLPSRELCSIKMHYPSVQQWFQSLATNGQLRVMKHLRREYERSVESVVFFHGRNQ